MKTLQKMSLNVPAALVGLGHCFRLSFCRRYFTKQQINPSLPLSGARRPTVSRVYNLSVPVILQHATLPSLILWFDKYQLHRRLKTVEQRIDFIRILSTRGYATTTRTDEPGTTRAQAILFALPDPSGIAPDEEVGLLNQNEAQFLITERAAQKLSDISKLENDPTVSLRVAVESGGCHGYQYKLELTSNQAPDD